METQWANGATLAGIRPYVTKAVNHSKENIFFRSASINMAE